MSTSGSTDYSIDRSGLITAALEDLGVLGVGGTATSAQLTHGATRLNLLIKAMGAQLGIPLWAMKRGFILPQTSGGTQFITSRCVDRFDVTNISADEASGQTVISVDSITAFSASDVIGVELDDGTMHWTTISGAPAAGTITLASAITAAASEGNQIYGYTASTDLISRPIRVVKAINISIENATDTPVDIVTNAEFLDISNKSEASSPTQLYYDPQLGSDARFGYWPRFTGGDKYMEIRYHRPFEDFDSATDTPDFPQEWFLPIQALLTWWLARSYQKPIEQRQLLFKEAMHWFDAVNDNDQEEGSIFLQPSENIGLR